MTGAVKVVLRSVPALSGRSLNRLLFTARSLFLIGEALGINVPGEEGEDRRRPSSPITTGDGDLANGFSSSKLAKVIMPPPLPLY